MTSLSDQRPPSRFSHLPPVFSLRRALGLCQPSASPGCDAPRALHALKPGRLRGPTALDLRACLTLQTVQVTHPLTTDALSTISQQTGAQRRPVDLLIPGSSSLNEITSVPLTLLLLLDEDGCSRQAARRRFSPRADDPSRQRSAAPVSLPPLDFGPRDVRTNPCPQTGASYTSKQPKDGRKAGGWETIADDERLARCRARRRPECAQAAWRFQFGR